MWILSSQRGPYALVRLLEIHGERGYRATTYEQPRQLIGYRRTLRSACEATHRASVRQHCPHPDPVNIYPDLSGDLSLDARR